MGKILSRHAAIMYLRNACGSMSPKTFAAEVAAGRIPAKPYGTTFRFRQEDLDQWQKITQTHVVFSNVAKSGTPISRSRQVGADMSFVKRRGVQTKTMHEHGVHNA